MGRRRVLHGHGRPCHWCGRAMVAFTDTFQAHPLRVTRDHVIPKARFGGGEDEGNIVLCCFTCNHIKGSMNPSEWAAYMAACPEWWKIERSKRRA